MGYLDIGLQDQRNAFGAAPRGSKKNASTVDPKAIAMEAIIADYREGKINAKELAGIAKSLE